MGSDLIWKSAVELADLLGAKAVSSREIVEVLAGRVAEVDGMINAYHGFDPELALKRAMESDVRRSRGEDRGFLDGIPIALKDLTAAAGEPLTCSSRMLANFVSPYDATVVTKLREAGAVLFGRTNMDEFAMGSSCETCAFGPTRNPWDLDRVPGGSSGGSAAAVAAGTVPLALGSDTGGSIRQPAAFCGVVGLKPTYGLVSRFGLVAFASSLDQFGPMGRTVTDCAAMLQVMVGHDPLDSTSFPVDIPDYRAALSQDPEPWRLGVPREYFGQGLQPEVREAVEKAIQWYGNNGCEIVEISLPRNDLAVPVYYIIAPAEASSNLARFDGVRYGHRSDRASDAIDLYEKSRGEGFGEEVKRRVLLGTYVLSSGYYDAYYLRAQKVRTLIRDDFMAAFEKVDAILTPTTPSSAFKMEEKADDPLSMYLNDLYTISANLAGLPAISLPCGLDEAGLPIGLQIVGQPYREAELLRIARSFEKTQPERRATVSPVEEGAA